MARASARLKPIEVPRLAKRPGMHCDGAGLYLRVAPPGAASWVLRYMLQGRARTMGLGPYPEIDLKEARARALEARRLKVDGIDPIEVRRAAKLERVLAQQKAMTFEECAGAYISSHRDGWKNAKHAAQWASTLKAYAYPIIGGYPVTTQAATRASASPSDIASSFCKGDGAGTRARNRANNSSSSG